MKNENKTIKAYKGFNSALRCRGFQYEVGKTYEMDDDIRCCERGFHACGNPLEVLSYYPPSDSRYCEVEQGGIVSKDNDGSKAASSKIHISCEIGLKGIIEAGVKFILDKVNLGNDKKSNTGNRSAATNTGYCSAATNTGNRSAATNTGDYSAATNAGDYSAATNTGDCSAATNTGDCSAATNMGDCSAATNAGDRSAATNTGYCSAATNTGNRSAATNTGNYSAATNTGDYSAATNTGDYSAATNTGYYSAATNAGDYSAATNTGDCSAATNTGYCSAAKVDGKESVAVVTGRGSKASGALGCWLVLTERGEWDGNTYPIKEVRAVKVDGETIMPDTWYQLTDGEVREVIGQ